MRNMVIVGQGPNRTAWENAIIMADKNALHVDNLNELERRNGRPPKYPANWREVYAEEYCARIAITGAVGQSICRLLDLDFPDGLCVNFWRMNLNKRWNGKSGKGDAFDADEGTIEARRLIDVAKEPYKFVMLGAAVTKCFVGVPLGVLQVAKINGHQFFHLPHPSRINLWWNQSDNRRQASLKLKEFCGL